MQYVDFQIRMLKDGDGFSVRAEATDAAGRRTGEAGPEVLNWAALQQHPAWETVALIRESPLQVKARDYAEVGGMLFDALLQGQVLRLFTALYDREVEPRKDAALRFRLDIDERSPEAAVVPWEFLYWRDKRLYFATNVQILMTRQLLNMDYGSIKPIRIDGLPRVLIVIPGGSDLNTDQERDNIEGALNSIGIEPTILEGAVDLGRLSDALTESGPYHILHFIGHGEFGEEDGEGTGFLRFNPPGDATEKVLIEHSRILSLLQNHRDLRLVVLNACSVGQISDQQMVERTGRGFIGMAPSILKAGIPAVVAMQYEIRDTIAIRFAEIFYKRLTKGRWAGQVDTAATLARNECLLMDPDDRGYATSILYLRSDDGVIFIPDGRQIAPNGPCIAHKKPDNDVLATYRFDSAKDLWRRMQVAIKNVATLSDLIQRLEVEFPRLYIIDPARAVVLRMQIEELKAQRDTLQEELDERSQVLAWKVYCECQTQQANKKELDDLKARPQLNLTESRSVRELKKALAEYDDLVKETTPYLREVGVIG